MMLRFEPLKMKNPSRTTWFVLGTLVAVGTGVTIFFSTRKAAAASAGKKAFTVSADCSQVTIVDESAAKGAATAAALAVRPSPSAPALQAAKDALRVAIPQCDWTNPPANRRFTMNGQSTTWAEIEQVLAGKTVGELTSLVAATSQGPLLPAWVYWLLGAR